MDISTQKQNIKIQIYILVVGSVLFVLKFIAYFFTGSVLILSDALESVVNLIAAVIGLYSLYLSSVPKDKSHPYGHGKVEFLTSGIEGGMIFFAGIMIIYESILRLLTPNNILHLDIGLGFIAITGLLNFLTGYWVKSIGNKNRNLQLIASGQHLITDAFSTIVVCAGIIVLYFSKINWLDGFMGILLGIYILFPSYSIIKNAVAGIMAESDEFLIKEFIDLIKSNKCIYWIDLHNLKILKIGSVIHVDCHLTLPFYWTIEQANKEVQSIEKLVKNNFGELAECSIQVDGCKAVHCAFCAIKECLERKQNFQENWKWDYEKITELH